MSIITNDDRTDFCSVCGRTDWSQGVQFERVNGSPWITVVCTMRDEGMSCTQFIRMVSERI